MSSRNFLSANWEYLAMFNYEVDPAVLRMHLPPYTEIDYYEGKAFVSIVGFLFNNTRVLGIQWPGFVHFEEVNLRYYVRHLSGSGWKRGVGFISEIVPGYLIASIANTFYNEHYSTAVLNHNIQNINNALKVEYNWKMKYGFWNSIQVEATPVLQDIASGSAEEFIFEHYYGYNRLNENTTIEYSLEHPKWQVYPVTDYLLTCDIDKMYGKAFSPFIENIKPASVFLARGSEVTVKMPRKIKA